jgi:hypothetical protein
MAKLAAEPLHAGDVCSDLVPWMLHKVNSLTWPAVVWNASTVCGPGGLLSHIQLLLWHP